MQSEPIPFVAMADQHKALASALKNLKGIHGSGSKKASAKEKEVVAEVEVPSVEEMVNEPHEDESAPDSQLRLRKRKKVSIGSSNISNVEGVVGSDNLMAKEASGRCY